MTSKGKLIIGGIVLLLGAGILNRVTLEPIAIGELCNSSGGCVGECLAFGGLQADYSHKEVCTQTCASNEDCPEATKCEMISLVTTDGTGGGDFSKTGYCLMPLPAVDEPK